LNRPITILFFLFVIFDILDEYYKFTNFVLVSRTMAIPIAYIGYLRFMKFKFEPIGNLLAISLFFSFLGLAITYLLSYGESYMQTTLLIYIVEAQIQLFIITHFFYPKDKSMKDEFTKLIIIFSTGILFIYFFFPMFSFGAQMTVFIRIMQFSFFVAYTYKNKLLHWQVIWSIWVLLLSNFISVLFLYLSPSKILHILVMSTLYISKFMFVNGLIHSIKLKTNIISRNHFSSGSN
jgi:hypothetical protein